jgi:hypothetical protein
MEEGGSPPVRSLFRVAVLTCLEIMSHDLNEGRIKEELTRQTVEQ